MATIAFRLLDPNAHDRAAFDCGEPTLNIFLQRNANSALKQGNSRTFACVDVEQPTFILGYYTLVYDKIDLEIIPASARRGFQGSAPILLLARLAIDRHFQSLGLGRLMVGDILAKYVDAYQVAGGAGIVVQAKNNNAAKFYQQVGFIPAESDALKLFLPSKTILMAFDL